MLYIFNQVYVLEVGLFEVGLFRISSKFKNIAETRSLLALAGN